MPLQHCGEIFRTARFTPDRVTDKALIASPCGDVASQGDATSQNYFVQRLCDDIDAIMPRLLDNLIQQIMMRTM